MILFQMVSLKEVKLWYPHLVPRRIQRQSARKKTKSGRKWWYVTTFIFDEKLDFMGRISIGCYVEKIFSRIHWVNGLMRTGWTFWGTDPGFIH
jgi:hypothetical protein